MDRNITFIQDIQDDYSLLSNLMIFLTDKNGNIVTEVSNAGNFEKEILNKSDISDLIRNYIKTFKTISNPTLVDGYYGIKLIVSPIKVNGESTYYIFAASILEQSTREVVRQYLTTKVECSSALLPYVDDIPELAEEEIRLKMKQIGNLTKVLTTYLDNENEKKQESRRSAFMHQSLDALRSGSLHLGSLLNEMTSLIESIDFLGIAIEQEEDHFKINTLHGEHTDQLKGWTFLTGEGFLGHTIATQQFQFWKNIHSDPRSNKFTQRGMQPISLFCIPIYTNHSIKGVLFGGSYEKELDEKLIKEDARLFSSLINMKLTTENLKNNLQNHLMELSTFNEIFRIITTVKDIKRVLYILVDISINLIRGPFSCIIFKPDFHGNKVEVVSRGLSQHEIKDYGNSVAKKAFSETQGEVTKQPMQNMTSWGVNVLEFPLMFNDDLYGILCVGYPKEEDTEKFKSFLSSLSVAGGVAIHLRQENRTIGTEDYIIEMLHKMMEKLNPGDHQLTIKVMELVKEFAKFLNFFDDGTLTKASTLCIYDHDLIKGMIENKKLLFILDEVKQVIELNKVTRFESELIALVRTYITQKENLLAVKQLKSIDDHLKNKFEMFINQKTIMISELSIEDTTNQQQSNVEDIENKLKRDFLISTRELDVLNYVLKGYSNREIASKLYISDHTVKNHMTNILQKLSVSDRSQAIAKVYQMGYSPDM